MDPFEFKARVDQADQVLKDRISQFQSVGLELIQQLDSVLDKNISRLERIANGLTVTNTTSLNIDERIPVKAQPAQTG